MKTTKLADGVYQIVGTDLVIERGDPPRYRQPQEWLLVPSFARHQILLIGYGKANVVSRVEMILAAMKGDSK